MTVHTVAAALGVLVALAHLTAIGIGLPALAIVLAWLFAGRDQPNLNRTLE